MPTDDEQTANILRTYYRVLNVGLDNNLEGRCVWLEERLKLSDEELALILRKYPIILQAHVENNLEPLLCWLQSRFKPDDESLRSRVQKFPNNILAPLTYRKIWNQKLISM
jgi:hypothetical protein